jgi:hypothetical protein
VTCLLLHAETGEPMRFTEIYENAASRARPLRIATSSSRGSSTSSPGVRVVQAVGFVSDDAAYASTMTMRSELAGVDGGTRVDIIADDVPDGIDADDHAAGLASSLTNLAEYLDG